MFGEITAMRANIFLDSLGENSRYHKNSKQNRKEQQDAKHQRKTTMVWEIQIQEEIEACHTKSKELVNQAKGL